MEAKATLRCAAFEGFSLVGVGAIAEVARKAKELIDRRPGAQVLFFEEATSETIEVDLRGGVDEVLGRLAPSEGPAAAATSCEADAETAPDADVPRGRGRPKLGVVAREVTLLPRHWEWLGEQPGGASVALRKLVEEARKTHQGRDRIRRSQEYAYRFLSAVAGDLPGFEEATRALFARRSDRFDACTAAWPVDVRSYAQQLAAPSFEGATEPAAAE